MTLTVDPTAGGADEAGETETGVEGLNEIRPEPLRRAATELAETWQERRGGWDAPDVVEPLAAVARRVAAFHRGESPDPDEHPPVGSVLHVRLAEALRGRLLRDWEEAHDGERVEAEELVELLLAVEKLLRILWPGKEDDPAARLGDPDALELVAEMAHDLLSPLNSILFLGETLRSGHSGPVNELQERQLGLMYSAALHVTVMAGDVMELTRGGRHSIAEPAAPFSIHDVFEMVEDMVRPMAEEKRVGLEFDAPSADEFIGHPIPLGRVILNLTTNGLKFTEKGEVRVSATRVGPSEMEFSVKDTGRGIPPEKQRFLFEPFRKPSGREGHFFSVSGLGLSICRRLVEAMGSELHLETELGKGTRFFFRLRSPRSRST